MQRDHGAVPDRLSTDEESVLQTAVLEDLSQAANYRRWLAGLAVPWLGDRPLEVGSGNGDYAVEWAQSCEEFTASEADQRRLVALRQRFAGHDRVRVRELRAPIEEDGDYSAVVAYNVLEHIEDHIGALRAFARLVRPGGRVILIVPAFSFAMSRFDREIGHHRRYTRRMMADCMAAAGLRVERMHYVNLVGLAAWTICMRFLRMRPKAGLGLRIYDAVVPLLATVERRVRPPAGQSVFVVASTTG